jgi:hypothetical protein
MKETVLPKFDYYLDESDPDILVLRRQDGAFVAPFSAQGATEEGIIQAAQEDYQAVLKAEHAASGGKWSPRGAPSLRTKSLGFREPPTRR